MQCWKKIQKKKKKNKGKEQPCVTSLGFCIVFTQLFSSFILAQENRASYLMTMAVVGVSARIRKDGLNHQAKGGMNGQTKLNLKRWHLSSSPLA